ncbi:MAG: YbbC/YhhH family protein [Oscillospiraceae bacterium]|jgi:hypothetical protein|nr:YbbC/YhhH family protein [Oscillospiraceae bacterium]
MLKTKKVLAALLASAVFLVSSCGAVKNNKPSESPIVPDSHRNYAFYETYNEAFNAVMRENPIDARMEAEKSEIEMANTREGQVFYDRYISIWQEELAFSIRNLEQYLTPEDLVLFEESQRSWEESVDAENQFSNALKESRDIGLGTQAVANALKYLIEKYRERDFYIKYMTYLAEVSVIDSVPEAEQTWNQFVDPLSSAGAGVDDFSLDDEYYQWALASFPSDKNVGDVLDAQSAIAKANELWLAAPAEEAYWPDEPINGEEIVVQYDAKYQCWLVSGTLKNEPGFVTFGGVPHALIQIDGNVLAVWHSD